MDPNASNMSMKFTNDIIYKKSGMAFTFENESENMFNLPFTPEKMS
jgi:hypothetical protein